MKDIGVRELKARATEIVRRVAENREPYLITRRGKPAGVLLPVEPVEPRPSVSSGDAWVQLDALAERIRKKSGRKSAVKALSKMRR